MGWGVVLAARNTARDLLSGHCSRNFVVWIWRNGDPETSIWYQCVCKKKCRRHRNYDNASVDFLSDVLVAFFPFLQFPNKVYVGGSHTTNDWPGKRYWGGGFPGIPPASSHSLRSQSQYPKPKITRTRFDDLLKLFFKCLKETSIPKVDSVFLDLIRVFWWF